SGPATWLSIAPIDRALWLWIFPRAPPASMPALSGAVAGDEFPRAGPAENKWTMMAYQTLAQSLSATRPAASDPKVPFSLPPSTLENNLDASLNTPSFPFRVECCVDPLRPPPKADKIDAPHQSAALCQQPT